MVNLEPRCVCVCVCHLPQSVVRNGVTHETINANGGTCFENVSLVSGMCFEMGRACLGVT